MRLKEGNDKRRLSGGLQHMVGEILSPNSGTLPTDATNAANSTCWLVKWVPCLAHENPALLGGLDAWDQHTVRANVQRPLHKGSTVVDVHVAVFREPYERTGPTAHRCPDML